MSTKYGDYKVLYIEFLAKLKTQLEEEVDYTITRVVPIDGEVPILHYKRINIKLTKQYTRDTNMQKIIGTINKLFSYVFTIVSTIDSTTDNPYNTLLLQHIDGLEYIFNFLNFTILKIYHRIKNIVEKNIHTSVGTNYRKVKETFDNILNKIQTGGSGDELLVGHINELLYLRDTFAALIYDKIFPDPKTLSIPQKEQENLRDIKHYFARSIYEFIVKIVITTIEIELIIIQYTPVIKPIFAIKQERKGYSGDIDESEILSDISSSKESSYMLSHNMCVIDKSNMLKEITDEEKGCIEYILNHIDPTKLDRSANLSFIQKLRGKPTYQRAYSI